MSPPSDWEKLLAWGERVLRRYKKQNPHQVCRICVTDIIITPTLSAHLLSNCCNKISLDIYMKLLLDTHSLYIDTFIKTKSTSDGMSIYLRV